MQRLGDVASAGLHGFTAALTSFIGRGAEVAEIASLVGEYRLVTVTGPGGIGKTRLAEVTARRVVDRFADGAWLVELAGVADPERVPAALMSALELHEDGSQSPIDMLRRTLASRQVLLVLDNCEHVVAAVARLCVQLLPAADDLRVLATSREPIGVPGEVRYRLGPLGLPDRGDWSRAARSESLVLFADRARRADPHFALDARSGPLASRIVARLDGVPLAIELVAAHVDALGLAQLANRLDDHLSSLPNSDRRAADRQRSLAATADWSYRLLEEAEQRVFRSLAIFPVPFTLDAAARVAGEDAGPAVLRLVDCSLLTCPLPGPDGARYGMLATLRTFGLDQLTAAGEHEEAAARLASYAADTAQAALAALDSMGRERYGADRLLTEHATVHQALTWALDHEPALAVRLAITLAPWWVRQGELELGYALLRRAAELTEQGREQWCAVQYWRGTLASGDFRQSSLEHFTEVRDALAVGEPSVLLIRALLGRSECLAHLRRFDESDAEGKRALALATELDWPDGQVEALIDLGVLAHYFGANDDSLACFKQAAGITRTAKITARTARLCTIFLARALREAGELDASRQLCTHAVAGARRASDQVYLAESLPLMADLELLASNHKLAGEHLREAIEVASRTGNVYRLLECIDLGGHLCAQLGRHADALTLWAARQAHWDDVLLPALPLEAERRDRVIDQARQALGASRADAARTRGGVMSLATATGLALLAADAAVPSAETGQVRLTARERELIALVAAGRTDAEIATELIISIRTVRSHLDRMRAKTGCRRRADLTRLALELGLI